MYVIPIWGHIILLGIPTAIAAISKAWRKRREQKARLEREKCKERSGE